MSSKKRQANQPAAYQAPTAYQDLITAISAVDADPRLRLAEVLESPLFEAFTAGWIGIEATSLYVTPQTDGFESIDSTANAKGLEFLHDVVNSPEPPMFIVSNNAAVPVNPARPYKSRRLDADEVKARRWVQQKSLQSAWKGQRTSAALCAKHLENPDPGTPQYLLLPFGEILAYCFLFHLVETGRSAIDEEEAWRAWRRLCDVQARRSNLPNDVSAELVGVLSRWYDPAARHTRDFLGEKEVAGVYKVAPALSAEFTKCAALPGEDPAVRNLVTEWANTLLEGLTRLAKGSTNLEGVFWANTLINPTVEEEFLTRGLYVTIIRSRSRLMLPTGGSSASSPYIGQAYAICTLYDSGRLEDEPRRREVDGIFRRIAQEDLGQYDYQMLQLTYGFQSNILTLLNHAGDREIDCKQLMEEAAGVCHDVIGAMGVLIVSPDVGVYSSFREKGGGSRPTTLWYGGLPGIAQVALELAAGLYASDSEGDGEVRALLPSSYARELKLILGDRQPSPTEDFWYSMVPVKDDTRGLLLLFFRSLPSAPSEVSKQVRRVGEILGIGMALPFRSTIGRGLLSWSVGRVVALFRGRASAKDGKEEDAKHSNKVGSKQSDGRHRRDSFERLLDWFVATIVEITRVGFVLIGGLLAVLVFYVLWSALVTPAHPVPGDTRGIVPTLRFVEAAVMAFSICLAATGVLFRLKPGMAAGQPGWLRRFAELGTLEQTLVRLAAMVLTIDVLSAALDPLQTRQQVLFHVLLYLFVLVGLAFLSTFLLADGQDDRSRRERLVEEVRSEDLISSAWSRLRGSAWRSRGNPNSRRGRQ